jgi:hypothetical protein
MFTHNCFICAMISGKRKFTILEIAKQDNFQSNKILMDKIFKVQQSKVEAQTLPKSETFFVYFLAGLSVLVAPLLMSPI